MMHACVGVNNNQSDWKRHPDRELEMGRGSVSTIADDGRREAERLRPAPTNVVEPLATHMIMQMCS